MTRRVCSSCNANLSDETLNCPRCGPQGLTLIISDEPAPGTAPPAMDVAKRLARALGSQYEVVRVLGHGGFAEVYEVKDADLSRRLAVKVLRPDLAWTAGMLARFKQESRAIARLSHPHTVPIHFVGEGEGLVFYAMPFVEGRSLAELLRSGGPLDVERALAIAEPIVDALEHAHQHGLIHRDIKPDNILIEADTGRPLLLDFGIAKSLDRSEHHTQTGFVVGTPLYMSPEQALGHRNVDARADVYAMGAVLFQMLTGAPPFEGDTSQEIVSKHLNEPVPLATLSGARIPLWLSSVILRCMAKRADDRYPSAAALLEALRAGRATASDDAVSAHRVAAQIGREVALPIATPVTQDETPTEAIPPTPVTARRPWRRRAVALSAALAAVAIGTAVAVRPRATFVVENRLLHPVAVALSDDSLRTLVPGDSFRIAVPGGEPLTARWSMVRPSTPSGTPLGVTLAGTLVAERPRGEVRRRLDASVTGQLYFLPRLVNGSTRPVSALVITGADSFPCECTVPPGDSLELGYYLLAPGASVRVTDDEGRTATLAELSGRVDPATGLVPLRIDATDLIAPPVRPTRVRARKAPSTVPDTAPTPSAKKTPRADPLRGILPVR